MKKKLLLLAAVLTASANLMFAAVDDKTVQDSNGNVFVYNPQTDLDPSSYEGATIYNEPANFSTNPTGWTLTLNSDQRIEIKDCDLKYNVRLINLSENPGVIAPFSKRLEDSYTIHEIEVKEAQLVQPLLDEDDEEIGYAIINGPIFERYKVACARAKEIDNTNTGDYLYLGQDLIDGKYWEIQYEEDGDEYRINPNLYYMRSGKNKKAKWYPVLNINGVYATGTEYSNSFATYTPVGIADNYISYEVDGTGKVGYVHGAVDDSKVEAILANNNYKYLNFDFSDVIVIGSVATDIIDNRIAYFNKNTDVTGQNIVVGTTCESYVIADNGQEIYVDKSFAAEESKYKRTFSPDSYGTIVLPFTVSGTGNIFVKQAKLTGYVPGPDNESSITNKLTFTSTEAIAPNTPYLYKTLGTVSGESIFFGDTNGTVKATEEAKSANYNGAQFIGTFEGLSAEEASNVYVVGMVGGVGKIGKTKKALKPGRCYFTYENTVNAKEMENVTIEIIDEDGSVETVDVDKTVTAIDGVVNGEVVSVQYISANGQISTEPFSGINLVKKTFEDGSVETSKVIF